LQGRGEPSLDGVRSELDYDQRSVSSASSSRRSPSAPRRVADQQVDLRGKTILVTGASSGIGAATVRLAAGKAGRVLLLARSAGKLHELAEELAGAEAEVLVFAVDCASPAEVERAAERIVAEVGVPDVLVNNAGAGRYLFFDETEPEEFERMMGAPFFAAVYVTRAFLPAMIRRGSGHVVSVNAPIAYVPWQGSAGYGMARWALRGFHELLRADLRGTGVKATQVIPGQVESSYFENNPGVREAIPKISRLIGTLPPEKVAAAILRACEREREHVFIPWRLRLTMVQARLFPRLTERVVWHTGRKRPD
jgi:short-subunit dehydrogenase